jgi:hypothetical protein
MFFFIFYFFWFDGEGGRMWVFVGGIKEGMVYGS